MRCEYKDGFQVDYSDSLRITKGEEINLLVKGEQIPMNLRGNLDAAARHNSCGEMRSAAEAVTDTINKAFKRH
jgi:hypothetical protein